MDKIYIKPGIGVGNINLGMTRDEVYNLLTRTKEITINSDFEILTYYSGSFRIYINKNNVVDFIELASNIVNHFNIFFEELDIFNTKAEEIIRYFEKYSNYDKENSEAKLGFLYSFKSIGITFWRSRVFNEETAQENWFKEMPYENQVDEMKYRFFEAVSVFKPIKL